MRTYRSFSWKEANFRICSNREELIIEEIKKQRTLLGMYIRRCPEFRTTFCPLDALLPDAPDIVCRMHEASLLAGVGPMAAVAGAVAHMAAEAAIKSTPALDVEAIVENGGDTYLSAKEEVVIALHAGSSTLSGKLAFRVKPQHMPVSICSSSSTMGHSLSFGDCDLATVVARDGALADAVATLVCNSVKRVEDVDGALEKGLNVPGVSGILIINGDCVGIAGNLPELVRHHDKSITQKITRAAGVVISHRLGTKDSRQF